MELLNLPDFHCAIMTIIIDNNIQLKYTSKMNNYVFKDFLSYNRTAHCVY